MKRNRAASILCIHLRLKARGTNVRTGIQRHGMEEGGSLGDRDGPERGEVWEYAGKRPWSTEQDRSSVFFVGVYGGGAGGGRGREEGKGSAWKGGPIDGGGRIGWRR